MHAATPKLRKQVAALPLRTGEDGLPQIMLMTSRETKRIIVPKGWPMKGITDHKAATIEARQEAGLVGRIEHDPIGSYEYWKRSTDHFELCRVKVYVLHVERQLRICKEQDQRHYGWLPIAHAVELVDDPGLATIILKLQRRLQARPIGRQRKSSPAD